LGELEAEAREIVSAGAGDAPLRVRRTALMRYLGQGHEVEVELPEGRITPAVAGEIRDRYERRYVELYGRALAAAEIEILTWNLAITTPEREIAPVGRAPNGSIARPMGHRRLFDAESGAFAEVPTYWRPDLAPGCVIAGPALIVEGQTTTVVPESHSVLVDEARNLVIERVDGEAGDGE
jgi:N-methylhydantoinase A